MYVLVNNSNDDTKKRTSLKKFGNLPCHTNSANLFGAMSQGTQHLYCLE